MNNITVNKLPKSKVEIKVEIPQEEFANYFEKALDVFVKDAEVDGFRKGTAPKELVKSKIGHSRILDRAAALAIEATYPGIILENKLEPLGYPEIAILKVALGSPLEYKAVVDIYPDIVLPDYKKIAQTFELKEPEVTKEDIEHVKEQKKQHLREHLRNDALAAIAKDAKIEVPEILVERETEKMMRQIKEKTPQTLGVSYEDYLKKINKTEDQLRDSIKIDNEQKIKNYMVLEEIAKLEKIEPSSAEIQDEIKKAGENENGEEGASKDQMNEYYRQVIKTEKTFKFLEDNFKK